MSNIFCITGTSVNSTQNVRAIIMAEDFDIQKWEEHFGKIENADWGGFRFVKRVGDDIIIEPAAHGEFDCWPANIHANVPFSVSVAMAVADRVGTMWGPFVLCEKEQFFNVVIPAAYCPNVGNGGETFFRKSFFDQVATT